MVHHGLIDEDQHVCHVIADSNGGANHPDNFHPLGGGLNQRLGRHGDHIMCLAVGLAKARKAVEVSRRYGNKQRGKYQGVSAEMLVEQGNRAWSQIGLLRPNPLSGRS